MQLKPRIQKNFMLSSQPLRLYSNPLQIMNYQRKLLKLNTHVASGRQSKFYSFVTFRLETLRYIDLLLLFLLHDFKVKKDYYLI